MTDKPHLDGGAGPAAGNTPQVLEHEVQGADPRVASELLALLSGLPRARVKDAMVKGAVWLRRPGAGGGERRLRRASTELRAGDRVAIYYDPRILDLDPPAAVCLADREAYSVWHKPAGLLAQGTRYGDHASLLRQAEKARGRPRPVFPVHRLDREASGLMLVAHTHAAARTLTAELALDSTEKVYRAEVRGDLAARHGDRGRIDLPLDGRTALTEYRVLGYDPGADASRVEVRIHTGRLHQIRRHLAALGCAVLGDPRYGRGNADPRGLRLVATRLALRCPVAHRPVTFDLPADLSPF